MQPADGRSPSHRLVTNREAGPDDAWVRAENATLGACLDAGLHVELAVSTTLLGEQASEVAAALGDLAHVEPTVLRTDSPVFRARPADRDRLLDALAVDGAVPYWRAHTVEAVAAFDPGGCRFYSVPDEPDTTLFDDGHRRLKGAVRAALADVPCSALFPYGPLASWAVGDVQVSLTPEALWLVADDGETRWYPNDRLAGVVVDPAATELVLSWPTRRDEAATSLGRLLSGALDRYRESPPRLLHPPDASLLETAATAYELVADRLCHDFEVRREPGVAERVRRL